MAKWGVPSLGESLDSCRIDSLFLLMDQRGKKKEEEEEEEERRMEYAMAVAISLH